MIDKKEVLSIVKEKGPVLPRDIVKELGGDTIITGAILSQLADKKEIKISHAKIGGSPVYYVQNQEEKLQMLYNYLHEKEKMAHDLLKQKKIIRDIKAEPAIRIALRNIKDFAKALEVNIFGKREIFWKWYLFPNADAERIIRETLKLELPKTEPKKEIPTREPEKKEEMQQTLKKEKVVVEESDLLSKIKRIFNEKQIEIIETQTLRKNSDIEMIIRIPSQVGRLNYFCKIRNKKKSNDKDLSSAYVQGEMKKLPVLYVITGELTKKAEAMLEKEFKMISILRI